MALEEEIQAIRQATALSGAEGRSVFRLSGTGAHAAADRLCPRELFLRDGQMLHTLLLNERANPVADAYLCADGEDYLLICEGPGPAGLMDLIRDRIPAGKGTEITEVTADHELVSLNGPYAWELLSEAISPEVIGLPYLGFYHGDGFTCFRAGKTGEFSFDLLLPKAGAAAMRDRLADLGASFGLRTVGGEALDVCALENFFFNIRLDSDPEATPLELQLQWRVSFQKEFTGAEALRQRRKQWAKRAVLIGSRQRLRGGDKVFAGNVGAGHILHAAHSFDRGEWLGLALLDLSLAHPGVRVDCRTAEGAIPARILSAPAINNRSLYVDPQRHAYATRGEDKFPPLVLDLAG
jgi:glycine cleavage system aminomethyltransferase T